MGHLDGWALVTVALVAAAYVAGRLSRRSIVCGCELDNDARDDVGWRKLGKYDDAPPQWIRVCELHARYGYHCEMSGFDEGLSK